MIDELIRYLNLFPDIMSRVSEISILIIALAIASIFSFDPTDDNRNQNTLFELTDPDKTGLEFSNDVRERPGFNVLESEFFFNGGGVAVGDINNDGLPDIYLSANRSDNALYLNEGDFNFRDITHQAQVTDSEGWSSGVTLVDINGDGLLDIYVCKSGKGSENDRRNKLFINNGDLTFTERASEYGLDDPGYTTHAVFFDYDRDGDLDVYLVNYSVKRYKSFDIINIRQQTDPYAGDKLLRNDNGHFTDVSREAGIIQNPIGFGLSATVSDINMDGWPDIYVTNDFIEKDYLYINQQNGTFEEEVTKRTTHISYFSMGADIADFNNDTFPDILTADMLSDRYERRRVFKEPDYEKYHQLTANGYHRQNMRNMLQMNNGDGSFTEIGQMAGIDKTDWSWAALLADYNNDGRKDLYVTNGFPRDYTNLDYLNNILWEKFPDGKLGNDPDVLYDLVQKMPEVRLRNHSFKNIGNLSFSSSGAEWGLDQYTVSTGAAYADLDNDGDLDLVVNNLNENVFAYKNRARELNSNNYLKVRLNGTGKNTFGTGAKITVTGNKGELYFQEAYPVRGYQSSVEPVLVFGLGDQEKVDLQVTWSDQTRQTIRDLEVNQTITVNKSDAQPDNSNSKTGNGDKIFLPLDMQKMGLNVTHSDGGTQNLNHSPLMPHSLSNLGPALAQADVNKDGLTDLYLGGGSNQPGRLLLQQKDGTFEQGEAPFFDLHKEYEDIDALFFDANNDGNPDLYVVSGGNFDPSNGPNYQDRLYINDGFGRFFHEPDALPTMNSSGGTVTAADFDDDGDPDLFVGGRVLTGKYPYAPRSYLLENNNGTFTDITSEFAPSLYNPGMITDAVWTQIDHDRYPDLVLSGEWMPIRIFRNNRDKTFTEITSEAGLDNTAGWWNALKAVDLDGDGDIDLVAGNRGLNADLNATSDQPAILFAGDFDGNGTIDPVMTQVIDGNRYPVAGRDKMLRQLPNLKEKFPDYTSYSSATIDDILTSKQRAEASQFFTHTFASTIFRNEGDGTFQALQLPSEAQASPIHDIVVADFNSDQILDILAAGNSFSTAPKTGPIASMGTLLIGNGRGGYEVRPAHATDFKATGEVRNMEVVSSPLGYIIMLARNGSTPVPYLYQSPAK